MGMKLSRRAGRETLSWEGEGDLEVRGCCHHFCDEYAAGGKLPVQAEGTQDKVLGFTSAV